VQPVEIFRVNNILAVEGGGSPPTFAMSRDHYLTELGTYHWTGKGRPAGTVALRSDDGKTYGPWQANLNDGVYWVARPNTPIPAGKYTVIDSEPATLATNAAAGGVGMSWAFGVPMP
jgi:hypothetical protein